MKYLILKMFLNEKLCEYHDVCEGEYLSVMENIRSLANESGRSFYFIQTVNDPRGGIPVDCTPFAEIEYNGEMAREEKVEYIKLVKGLFNDGDIKYEHGVTLETVNTLSMVKFKKTDDEIFTIE